MIYSGLYPTTADSIFEFAGRYQGQRVEFAFTELRGPIGQPADGSTAMGCAGGKDGKGAPANLRGQEQQKQQQQLQAHPAPVQQHAAQQHHPAPVQQPVPQSAHPVNQPPTAPIDPFLTPGYLIGNKYQPTSVIGQGGFGRTYMGTDQQTAQPVHTA